MNANLDELYLRLDAGTRMANEAIGPGNVARLDRDAAVARDVLAGYGISLADDTARDAVAVVVEQIAAALGKGSVGEALRRVGALQQAVQRANAAAARTAGT